MNSGIENYRRTNLSIQSSTTNPADIYKNFPGALSNQLPVNQTNQANQVNQTNQVNQVNQVQLSNQIQQIQQAQQSNQVSNPGFVQQTQYNSYPHQQTNLQMNPITPYIISNQNQNEILSQIDLLEKDINNIFSNNITPDRLERLGSGVISNGQYYDSGSLNPKHQMLGEFEKPTNLIHNNISKNVLLVCKVKSAAILLILVLIIIPLYPGLLELESVIATSSW
jgi:hypothetical protein